MRNLIDVICVRCHQAFSVNGSGLSLDEAIRLGREAHVCVDGVRHDYSSPFEARERRVAGPGERTKLPEERSR